MGKKYSTVKWSIWWLLAFSFILVLFFRISTAVITDNLSKELGFTQLQISNIASLALYSYAIMQIPAGILIDKYGARKISSIGMIIGGMGSILFGTINNIHLAYISRIMVGAGTSVIILSMFKLQGNWFKKEEFASITTKFSFIGNLGSVCATFPLVYLNDFIGWRNSFILIGTIGVVIGFSIYIIVRDTPKEYNFDEINIVEVQQIKLKEGLKSVFTNKSTWYNIPNNVVGVLVNPITGMVADENDVKKEMFFYLKGTEPTLQSVSKDLDAVFKEENIVEEPVSPEATINIVISGIDKTNTEELISFLEVLKQVNGSNIKTINNKTIIGKNAQDLELVETSAVTSAITSSSTNSQVPTAKAVYDQLGGLKLQQITQADYDALVQGGTVDASTLYIITNVVN